MEVVLCKVSISCYLSSITTSFTTFSPSLLSFLKFPSYNSFLLYLHQHSNSSTSLFIPDLPTPPTLSLLILPLYSYFSDYLDICKYLTFSLRPFPALLPHIQILHLHNCSLAIGPLSSVISLSLLHSYTLSYALSTSLSRHDGRIDRTATVPIMPMQCVLSPL